MAAASVAPATDKRTRAVECERIPVGDGPTACSMPAIAGSVGAAGGYFGVVVTYFNALPSYTGS